MEYCFHTLLELCVSLCRMELASKLSKNWHFFPSAQKFYTKERILSKGETRGEPGMNKNDAFPPCLIIRRDATKSPRKETKLSYAKGKKEASIASNFEFQSFLYDFWYDILNWKFKERAGISQKHPRMKGWVLKSPDLQKEGSYMWVHHQFPLLFSCISSPLPSPLWVFHSPLPFFVVMFLWLS